MTDKKNREEEEEIKQNELKRRNWNKNIGRYIP